MPSISMEVESSETKTNSDLRKLSPKDVIFEEIMNMYPPLKQIQNYHDNEKANHQRSNDTNQVPQLSQALTGLGELDIRQKYHPALSNLSSSDLDIVTVGTASCIPGVTRGVSCTALRLQWRRNSKSKDGALSTGGIWIFDAGEGSQVSIYFLV